MNILHTVEFYDPSVGGAQEVVKRISEGLVQLGHNVTVATTKLDNRLDFRVNGVKIKEFDISGNLATGLHGDISEYQDFVKNGKFDLMMNYAAQEWTADSLFSVLSDIPFAKVFAPCGFSGLSNPVFKSYFENMPTILNQYDGLIFHSNTYQDAAFALKHGIKHRHLITNGCLREEFENIDPTFRKRYGIAEDTPLYITVGSHTGLKGHTVTIKGFKKARIGKAVLIVIGNTPGGHGCLPKCKLLALWVNVFSLWRKQVLLLNPIRKDVVAAYHAANYFIFASNVECSPIVLFEAMASRTPFASVSCGNATEIIEWSNGGFLIPANNTDNFIITTPSAVSNAMETLLNDPNMCNQLADNGYKAWDKSYSWEKITKQYEEYYLDIIKKHKANVCK